MRIGIKTLIGFVGVVAGLIAIFKLVPDTELAIGFITISFGILAVIWTSMAISSLSEGSSLRRHTTNFLLCLVFVLLDSIWRTLLRLFNWEETIGKFMLYPGYAFITLAFLIFVMTAYQTLKMGKEFGFKSQATKIKKALENKKKKD